MGNALAAGKLPPLRPGEFRFATKGLSIEMEPAGEDGRGRRRWKAIASSTAKDLRGDEMQMSAMQDMVASFRRGLNIFMDHNHTAENVFGRSDTAEILDSGERDPRNGAQIWDLHIGGTVNEPNPRAVQLADSIDGGYVSFGTSIGAFVTEAEKKRDGGRLIAHVDCKEASIVGIPMNQRAWTYKSADANWTFRAADAAERMEQNALFDGDDAGGSQIEQFSLDASEGDPETSGAPAAVAGAQTAIPVSESLATSDSDTPDLDTKAACATCGKEHEGDCDNDGDAPAKGDDPDLDGKSVESDLDTTGGQEASEATPETAPEVSAESDPATTQKALVFESDDVVELVRKAAGLADLVTKQATQITDLTTERDTLAAENKEAKAVIEKMLKLPLRPQAVSHAQTLSHRLPDFLDPAVVKMLTESQEN